MHVIAQLTNHQICGNITAVAGALPAFAGALPAFAGELPAIAGANITHISVFSGNDFSSPTDPRNTTWCMDAFKNTHKQTIHTYSGLFYS